MSMTPHDIVRKEFREAFRGYNQAEVDLFLDEVVEAFTRAVEENQKMKVRLAALQQEVARLRDGRGGAPTAGVSAEDAERMEGEVRARVRRFLEEQIQLIDAGPQRGTSSTVERIAREVNAPVSEPEPTEAPVSESHEPFWAGE